MYGGISEPGMGTYPPRVRRDRGVSPRGNSRRARLAPWLVEGGRGESPRPIRLGLGKRWDESHLPIILYQTARIDHQAKGRPGAIYPRPFPPRRAACVSFNARPSAFRNRLELWWYYGKITDPPSPLLAARARWTLSAPCCFAWCERQTASWQQQTDDR